MNVMVVETVYIPMPLLPRLAATVMALLRRSGQGDRCKQENEEGCFRANHHAPLDHR